MIEVAPESKDFDTSMLDQVESLAHTVFPFFKKNPAVLGYTDDIIIAPDVRALLDRPTTAIATSELGGKVIGFSFAIPIDRFNPKRVEESRETAYIYGVGIQPDLQGNGYIAKVNRDMDQWLLASGYRYVEVDATHKGGYAKTLSKVYKDAIIDWADHHRYPEIGPQRFFRINLRKLIANRGEEQAKDLLDGYKSKHFPSYIKNILGLFVPDEPPPELDATSLAAISGYFYRKCMVPKSNLIDLTGVMTTELLVRDALKGLHTPSGMKTGEYGTPGPHIIEGTYTRHAISIYGPKNIDDFKEPES